MATYLYEKTQQTITTSLYNQDDCINIKIHVMAFKGKAYTFGTLNTSNLNNRLKKAPEYIILDGDEGVVFKYNKNTSYCVGYDLENMEVVGLLAKENNKYILFKYTGKTNKGKMIFK